MNRTKGDLNNDGRMSDYENARQTAIEKNIKKEKKMAGGGMMKPMTKMGHGGEMKKMGKGGNMMKTYAYGSMVRKPMQMGGMAMSANPMAPREQKGMAGGMSGMMYGGMMKKKKKS